MARTGRPRQDLRQSPIEHLEAFCCLQVRRIQQSFHAKYGLDYDGRERSVGDNVPGNRYHVMRQNDDMTKAVIIRDGILSTRR
jgi:hypothetical protein